MDALAEAERLLQQATEQAGETVRRARSEAEAIRRQGERDGRAEAAAVLLAARTRSEEIVGRARDGLTRLAVAIAEKLLGEALRLDPARIEGIVASCIEQSGLREVGRLVLRVSPGDLAVVEGALPRLRQQIAAGLLAVEGDPSVAPGGCVMETELGQVDGQLETRLETIRRALEVEP